MKLLKTVKKKANKLDNERLAIAVISLIGLGLLFPLLVIAPGLLETEWFLDLITIPAEYGSFIADGAYIGRLLNLFTARSLKTKNNDEKTNVTTLFNKKVVMARRIGIREKELTPIGLLLGIGLALACIALHAAVPFLNSLSYFAYVLFTLGYACALGGLFNRLGSSMDGTRLTQEKKAILFGSIIGLIVAFSLIGVLAATGTLPLVAVAGVSKIFFDLLVLHKTLFTLTLALSVTSLTTSFCDYFAKAYCFLKYSIGSQDSVLNERLKSRYHEYRGACFGIVAGCLLAIGVITGLVLTGGLAAAPFAVTATIVMTIIVCNSAISALFSRVGRVIDGIKRKTSTDITIKVNKNKATPVNDSAGKPSLTLLSNSKTMGKISLVAEDVDDKENKSFFINNPSLKRIKSCPNFFYPTAKLEETDCEVIFSKNLTR